MKMIIVVAFAVLAVAVAAPPETAPVVVVKEETERHPDGSYRTYLETSDGVKKEETGELKEALNEKNEPVRVIAVRGSYSVPDAEGRPHTTYYSADEFGFKAEGEDIPQVAPLQ